MSDIPRQPPPAVRFDPSTIPKDDLDRLCIETLRLVSWILTIPECRACMAELSAAIRRARGGDAG